VGDPDLLILDEPSSGLDPAGAKEMRDLVRAEADRGTTIFFSSHVLGQVEAVCDRVGILRGGELVAEDSIEGLREARGDDTRLVVTIAGTLDGSVETVRDIDGVTGAHLQGKTLTVSCSNDAKTRVIRALESSGVVVEDFKTEQTSLEDLFLAYTDQDDAEGTTTTTTTNTTANADAGSGVGAESDDTEAEEDTEVRT
jgi:ABC-2 type transport system ATP-binding protein